MKILIKTFCIYLNIIYINYFIGMGIKDLKLLIKLIKFKRKCNFNKVILHIQFFKLLLTKKITFFQKT